MFDLYFKKLDLPHEHVFMTACFVILSKALNLHGLWDSPIKTATSIMNGNAQLCIGVFLSTQFLMSTTPLCNHQSSIRLPRPVFGSQTLICKSTGVLEARYQLMPFSTLVSAYRKVARYKLRKCMILMKGHKSALWSDKRLHVCVFVE